MLNDPELEQFEDAEEDLKNVNSLSQCIAQETLNQEQFQYDDDDEDDEEDEFSDYDEDFREFKGPNSQVYFKKLQLNNLKY